MNQRVIAITLIVIAALLAFMIFIDFADKRAAEQWRQEQEHSRFMRELEREMDKKKQELWDSVR